MRSITINGAVFYSSLDETNFFRWLESIDSVRSVAGVGKQLEIEVVEVADGSLRELIALFYRYNLDGRVLAQFETDANSSWFRSAGSYWYGSVFTD